MLLCVNKELVHVLLGRKALAHGMQSWSSYDPGVPDWTARSCLPDMPVEQRRKKYTHWLKTKYTHWLKTRKNFQIWIYYCSSLRLRKIWWLFGPHHWSKILSLYAVLINFGTYSKLRWCAKLKVQVHFQFWTTKTPDKTDMNETCASRTGMDRPAQPGNLCSGLIESISSNGRRKENGCRSCQCHFCLVFWTLSEIAKSKFNALSVFKYKQMTCNLSRVSYIFTRFF